MKREVLVVEDDEMIATDLAGVLEDEGFKVVRAAQGLEALQFLREGLRPSVILLDLMMPVMNGWEFRAQMLSEAEFADIPLILLSSVPDIRQQAVTLCAHGFLNKPIDIDQLLAVLRSVQSS